MRCVQGRCALDLESVVSCVASNTCEIATCDPATGECTLENADDGEPCDDGDACTQADQPRGLVGEALEW